MDPGWKGDLALELSNVANLPIALYFGMHIGQISFFKMSSAVDRLLGHELPQACGSKSSTHAESLKLLRDAVRSGAIQVARDISEGGLATTLAECCLGGTGVEIDLEPLVERMRRAFPDAGPDEHVETSLWGEGPGGIVIAGTREALLELSNRARGVGFLALGQTGGNRLSVSVPAGTLDEVSLDVTEIQRVHGGALAERVAS